MSNSLPQDSSFSSTQSYFSTPQDESQLSESEQYFGKNDAPRERSYAQRNPLVVAFGFMAVVASVLVGAAVLSSRQGGRNMAQLVPTASPMATARAVATTEPMVDDLVSPTPLVGTSQGTTTRPSVAATATPAPTPTPVPLANIYYERRPQIKVKRIIHGDVKTLPEGHISNANGQSFYYQYDSESRLTTDSIFQQGDELTFLAKVQNSEATPQEESTLRSVLKFGNLAQDNIDFTIPKLQKGETKEHTITPNVVPRNSGNIRFTWHIDYFKKVPETREDDNTYELNVLVKPDTIAPYLEVYPYAVAQSGTEMCFDYRAVFTRDDQDALDGKEASTRTQLRFRTSHHPTFTNWTDYKQLNETYPNKLCVTAAAGKSYILFVESRDQNGNVAALSMGRVGE